MSRGAAERIDYAHAAQLRAEGLSYRDISRALGVAPSVVHHALNGRSKRVERPCGVKPGFERFADLAEILSNSPR